MWWDMQVNTLNTRGLVPAIEEYTYILLVGRRQQHKTKMMITQICLSECVQDKHELSTVILERSAS